MTDRDAPVARRRVIVGFAGLAIAAGCAGPGVDDTPTNGSPSPAPDTPTQSPQTTDPTGSPPPASGEPVDVAAGPEGRLRFVPDRVEIAVGDTVRWTFESSGHNVTSKPGASEQVRNPPDAEPFASYEGDDHFSLVPPGETFEHTFTVPGEYVYVCAPHAGEGMVGTVVVSA